MTKSVFFQAQAAITLGLIAAIGASEVAALTERVNTQVRALLDNARRTGDLIGDLTIPDPDTGLLGIIGETRDGFKFDYRTRWLTEADDAGLKGGKFIDPETGTRVTSTTVVTLPDGETTQTYEQLRLQAALDKAGSAVGASNEDIELSRLIELLLGGAGRDPALSSAAC